MMRGIWGLLACCSLVACDGNTQPATAPAASVVSTIFDENARPADRGWVIDDAKGDDRFGAFARPLSVAAGEQVTVAISAAAPTTASWSVYRLGHYGGAGGRRVAEGANLAIGPQPAPPRMDAATGLIECDWPPSITLTAGDDWTSGLYVVRVEDAGGAARYAPFVVRDQRRADVVVVLPTATAQAYNDWGGESLYVDRRFGLEGGHARVVSYDRPFAAGAGGGSLLVSTLPAIVFLEANGYDVTYLADPDVARDQSSLGRARLGLVLAHSEYWTRAMRDAYEQARDGGVSLGFLGANMGYWQIRLEPAPDGMPDRRQVGYKEMFDLGSAPSPRRLQRHRRPSVASCSDDPRMRCSACAPRSGTWSTSRGWCREPATGSTAAAAHRTATCGPAWSASRPTPPRTTAPPPPACASSPTRPRWVATAASSCGTRLPSTSCPAETSSSTPRPSGSPPRSAACGCSGARSR